METTGRLLLPRRRLTLFLVVFGVPFGVLSALAIRTLNQDRELAVRRAEDARRQVATAIRQEFLGRLENLKLRAMSDAAWLGNSDRATDAADAVVLIARVDNGRLVLPWEARSSADVRRVLAEQPYADLIAGGEREELVHQRPRQAVTLYRRAIAVARQETQTASAELLMARALAKEGAAADVLAFSRRSLTHPLSLVDEHGVPYALYAARRLADLERLAADDARAVLATARQAGAVRSMSPAALHMATAVVSTLQSKGPPETSGPAADARQAIAALIARSEQALALQQMFPALATQLVSHAPSNDHLWLPFGRGPWLLSLAGEMAAQSPSVVAIEARDAFDDLESAAVCTAAGGCRLAQLSGAGPDGYPFGAALPGLTLLDVRSSEADESLRWLPRQAFCGGSLALVLLAGFGGYLLWRDVRRELRVAHGQQAWKAGTHAGGVQPPQPHELH